MAYQGAGSFAASVEAPGGSWGAKGRGHCDENPGVAEWRGRCWSSEQVDGVDMRGEVGGPLEKVTLSIDPDPPGEDLSLACVFQAVSP